MKAQAKKTNLPFDPPGTESVACCPSPRKRETRIGLKFETMVNKVSSNQEPVGTESIACYPTSPKGEVDPSDQVQAIVKAVLNQSTTPNTITGHGTAKR